ncbi:ABC transporter ATP-binding protein [Gilliamella sp. B2776]|uniref:ABC transporter ATP-binding protein n=1 Tax=unclassified Gilliamella TaxID=2685620 RepID=UPI00226A7869|nr:MULTISPECIES: ABC transporter ATP-binding protein [unclassified Gilliamella]MCX8650740.1 ABC transporter ATP-binding protein [Gilliamella sp. B2779]MCX8654100.1 ABC transporter ATP-binding protein [Gilliamella sp. B2737]MCX8657159.1 ABC transporter ATP-binding protein [Gilliamella sp. B2894]MCX8665623.1 ABC transporter ATP-binding protein [Gilliamella sp. B2887]MCX8692588.1 ABC transporter ATP-binding protein [Gilliamella sp. B2776]
MIIVDNVCKKYTTRKGYKTVLDNISFTLHRGEKLGILGRNGAGKSTLIRLISQIEKPTSGTIKRSMTISWPLAFTGAFQGSLTGMDNLRFICRIYQTDIKKTKEYVEDFAELGDYLYEPIKKYSSGMKARLAFALSLSIEFDCYLIDEVIVVGDSRFTQKCKKELFENKKDRSLILVSHNMNAIKSYCDKAMVLEEGHLHQFDTIDQAHQYHTKQQRLT